MKLEIALLFILTMNILLFSSQLAVNSVADETGAIPPSIYNYENSLLQDYDAGDYTLNSSVETLPTGQGQIEPESGNFFTDIFATARDWLLEATGAKYILGIVTAFPNFVENMGLPSELAFMLGVIWHALTFFLFIAWLFQRL